MALKVTILGSGGSMGVPGVGLGWGECDPTHPRNRRTRPSILIESKKARILVDTSPDLREQLTKHDIERLDAVLMTHAHADHLHGIDDLRGINRSMASALNIYADQTTFDAIKKKFGYVFDPIHVPQNSQPFYYKPVLIPNIIEPNTTFRVGDLDIQVMEQSHGHTKTLGYRFGSFAYSTDVKELSEYAFQILEGVSVWVIGSPVIHPNHPSHIDINGALKWIKRIAPRRAFISHLGLDIDYETVQNTLPEYVNLAYDGLVIHIES